MQPRVYEGIEASRDPGSNGQQRRAAALQSLCVSVLVCRSVPQAPHVLTEPAASVVVSQR